MSPSVYIIAGPNGAGKTTFAREYLPRLARSMNFVNADLIAQGLSPFSPEAAVFRAGRVMLRELELHIERREDFGFESTLSGQTYLALLRRVKETGYILRFYYLWVASVDLALRRIKARVMEGGHDVPEADVRRRYARSMRNFLTHYRPLADSWTLYDNSALVPRVIAFERRGGLRIMDAEAYEALVARYGKQ